MANIIVIENDVRFKREIEKFVRELGQHKVRFFDSGKDFFAQYFKRFEKKEVKKAPSETPAPEATQEPHLVEGEELKLFSVIDLVIFRNTCVENRPPEWCEETFQRLQQAHYFPEERTTRFILTMFEDEKLKKNTLIHPLLDDLIFLPFDRLIFLQKIEMILAMPKRQRPSYLFLQEGKFDIEISKRSKLTRICDTGFSLVNPFQLRPGTTAHFFLKFPGEDASFGFYAKAHSSEKAPMEENKFLVNFMFFGLNKDETFRIKKYLSQKREYRPFQDDDERRFRFHEENLFLTAEEKRKKQILVLDSDPNQAKALRDTIQSQIDNCVVSIETSYHLFLRKYFQKTKAETVPPIQVEDLFIDPIQFTVDRKNNRLIQLLTPPMKPEHKMLGFDPKNFFDRPDDWKKFFNWEDSEKIVTEVMANIREGQSVERPLVFKTANGDIKRAHGRFARGVTTEVRLEIGLPPDVRGQKVDPLSPVLTTFDAVVLDGRFLAEDADSWISGLEDLMRLHRMPIPADGVKVIALAEESEVKVKKLRDSRLFALLLKPHSMHLMLQAICIATKSPHSKYTFSNQGWFDINLEIFVAQEAVLNSISEFGASITHPRPIAPGTFLYLHGSIFNEAPDSILCARFYFCEPDANQKEQFECHFLYWGINDHFLRFARTWIRENYAQSKGFTG